MTSHPIVTPQVRRLQSVGGSWAGGVGDPLADLPPVIDLVSAAGLLGLGRTTAYKLVRTGEWPTPIIRIGRLIKVPTAPLRDLLTGSPPTGSSVTVAPGE
jgi:hypothetical protein